MQKIQFCDESHHCKTHICVKNEQVKKQEINEAYMAGMGFMEIFHVKFNYIIPSIQYNSGFSIFSSL